MLEDPVELTLAATDDEAGEEVLVVVVVVGCIIELVFPGMRIR